MIFITAQQNLVSMFSFHKIVYLKDIICSIPSYTNRKIDKICTKPHFMCRKYTFCTHLQLSDYGYT